MTLADGSVAFECLESGRSTVCLRDRPGPADLHWNVTHRSQRVGPTPSSCGLLGEILLRLTELTVVVGGGVLMVTTQTLDAAGIAVLVMLCATWAVLGSIFGALQLEAPYRSQRLARSRRHQAPCRASGPPSVPIPSARGRLSLTSTSGNLSLRPAKPPRTSGSILEDRPTADRTSRDTA